MFQLIYASTATRYFDKDEMRGLLEHARKQNERRGITGMLVHRNGSFLHVLEGEEETVRALYQTIREDERHHWVTLLKAVYLDERDFAGTPLAFRDRSVAGARRYASKSSHAGSTTHETLAHFERAIVRPEAPAARQNAPERENPTHSAS